MAELYFMLGMNKALEQEITPIARDKRRALEAKENKQRKRRRSPINKGAFCAFIYGMKKALVFYSSASSLVGSFTNGMTLTVFIILSETSMTSIW